MGARVEQEGAEGGEMGGATRFVRGNNKSFKGIHLMVLEGMHQSIM